MTDKISRGNNPESSTDGESPPKRPKYACTFRPGNNSFPWAKVSRKGPSYALCTVCSRDISVAYGGMKDLRKHEQTKLHKSSSSSISASSSLSTFFGSARSRPCPKRERTVVEAELKFAYFIGERYLALNVGDHCSQLFCSIFPDTDCQCF